MRHTKHDSLSGRKAVRSSELDLPTKEEMRKVERWLSGQSGQSELPKRNNIEDRKRKNRARAKACKRVIRWQQRHRKAYNAKMRAYRRRKKASACQVA